MQEKLHVIIPIFNISNSQLRYNNFKKTIQYLKLCPNLCIYIVEGYLSTPIFNNIIDIDNKNIFYLKYKMPSTLWVKENLINLAVKKLPKDWKYMAWIDSDIIFLNSNWGIDTIEKLQDNDTVQLFRTASFLDQNGNIYVENDGKEKHLVVFSFIFTNMKYKKYGHPGFGWAITKKFYKKIGKIFEYNIIGAADLLYAKACIQQDFLYKSPSFQYDQLKLDYFNNFKNVKYDYINGHIVHIYHGFFEKREYKDRWNILIRHNFNPQSDLIKVNGILKLKNQDLENDIINYFKRREEV